MPKIKVKGQTVQTGERPRTNGGNHKRTDATKRIIFFATRSIRIVLQEIIKKEIKKKEINGTKLYSLVGNCGEQAKQKVL